MLRSLDRNDGPQLLLWAANLGEIDRGTVRANLLDVWTLAEWPGRSVTHTDWLYLFELAGSFYTGPSMTLYRGAVPRWRLGMSWTADRERAQWFAERNTDRGRPGSLYETTAPACAILCDVDAADPGGRDEREVIINPYRLGKVTRLEKITR
jgi:hypothetical protein